MVPINEQNSKYPRTSIAHEFEMQGTREKPLMNNPDPKEMAPDYDLNSDYVKPSLRKGAVEFSKQSERKPNMFNTIGVD